jgi:hypothetical protein
MSAREWALAAATAIVGLGALTWQIGQPRVAQWRKLDQERRALEGRRQIAERMAARRPEAEGRLRALLKQVPSYPPDRDVTAELLRTMESLAARNTLVLVRREAEKEKIAGELHEVAINGTWQGSLESLVRFLFDAQTQGILLDVRQLNITPARVGGGLSGTFSIACAYTREGPAEKPAANVP